MTLAAVEEGQCAKSGIVLTLQANEFRNSGSCMLLNILRTNMRHFDHLPLEVTPGAGTGNTTISSNKRTSSNRNNTNSSNSSNSSTVATAVLTPTAATAATVATAVLHYLYQPKLCFNAKVV